jgi:uncharacterized protein (DUF697 family)
MVFILGIVFGLKVKDEVSLQIVNDISGLCGRKVFNGTNIHFIPNFVLEIDTTAKPEKDHGAFDINMICK